MTAGEAQKPIIMITGGAGNIGSALCRKLRDQYHILGLDIKPCSEADDSIEIDLTSAAKLKYRFDEIKKRFGKDIAAVIHLAAYFDFTGEESPLYKKINEEGTRNLLECLKDFEVERFIYSGTMLVHRPGVPGQDITERSKIEPTWAYPESKARTEDIIKKHHGKMPYTILRLAGVYNEKTAVPTLAHQIVRIYERDIKSHLYSGNTGAGQTFLHTEDMLDAFVKTIEHRKKLPKTGAILIGEDTAPSYEELQNRIGHLIHGETEWKTLTVPESMAVAGAWIEEKSEPVIPDAIDQGEKPFIRPFMVRMASDHYGLDISKAKKLLDWEPRHSLIKTLPKIIDNLRKDPAGWYKANQILPPDWIETATEKDKNPDTVRSDYEQHYQEAHRRTLWTHFMNLGFAAWLITAPFTLGYESAFMVWSDMISGAALALFALLSLSPRFGPARWVCAAIGFWLLFAPLAFWAPTAAAYMNGTLIGMLVIGFSVLVGPPVGISPVAATTGPSYPPGWDSFSPSSWFQRAPIILLAFVGFFISRYLTAYQLGHIDAVWEPFFAGALDNPKNGTEEIITSSVSEAWPVPDAGLGAMTYALEIMTGLLGSTRRWRTMPWVVMAFGIMIVPLGIISITFIIIQPILLGTWCTLCLIAAAAMLIQIPYSFDELVATGQFLYRRKKAGRSLLKVFFTGDTDDGDWQDDEDSFRQKPRRILREMLGGGVSIPWNLALCVLIGGWLMLTRMSFGTTGGMADADHLIGALVITVAVTCFAETARLFRFVIIPLGAALLITPFVYEVTTAGLVNSLVCGVALIALSLRRGPAYYSYGSWDRFVR